MGSDTGFEAAGNGSAEGSSAVQLPTPPVSSFPQDFKVLRDFDDDSMIPQAPGASPMPDTTSGHG